MRGENLIYVGWTSNLSARIHSHRQDPTKNFNRVLWHYGHKFHETALIAKLGPECNLGNKIMSGYLRSKYLLAWINDLQNSYHMGAING